jgi:glycosyltransferase involved in cell wall biosynthesis
VEYNYVFLGDYPGLDTGFANVNRNIITRMPFRSKVHFWGIGYDNTPHDYDFKLYSANINANWRSHDNINRFHHFLKSFYGPIILFVLQDSFRMADFNWVIDSVRETNILKIISYTPVDSYLTALDETYLRRVDYPVAYNMYGYEYIKLHNKNVSIIPHGINFKVFNTDKKELKQKYKQLCFPQLPPDKFLITNVNTNSNRKDPISSLHILKELIAEDSRYYMYMHMRPSRSVDLRAVCDELEISDRVIFADPFFDNDILGKTLCSEDELSAIYTASDLVISTSRGEGWGLTAFEAAACGTPIAVPNHTSFKEAFSDQSAVMLPIDGVVFEDQKMWPAVDIKRSADKIHRGVVEDALYSMAINCTDLVSKFNWDAIADQWVDKFKSITDENIN